MAQGRSQTLRLHGPVIDSHIVDQAGPERARGEGAAGAEVEVADRHRQASLRVSRYFGDCGIAVGSQAGNIGTRLNVSSPIGTHPRGSAPSSGKRSPFAFWAGT